MNKPLLLAYYGDDFTGSTDALEFLSRAGAKTVLFIEPPTAQKLAAYPHLDAIGVAGHTRSLPPAEMEQILRPAFTNLQRLGARHVHYKVCSTFDSSPSVGSIGKAIDVGAEVFKNKFTPLLVAAPSLGRYCLFGNLFARLGTGGAGTVYRLDRHPSMMHHPTTPANESDLRLHLSKQTDKKIGLLDVLQIAGTQQAMQEDLQKLLQQDNEVILIDALYEEQLTGIGALIDNSAKEGETLFSVGSSGIEMALGKYWNTEKILEPVSSWPKPGNAGPLLVLSGSCSPVTAKQIAWAKDQGFVEIPLEEKIVTGDSGQGLSLYCNLSNALSALQNNQSIIIHTGAIKEIKQASSAKILGKILGDIGKKICAQTGIKRIVVAGGDTSSYVARAMGIEAVEMIAPVVPGAPLCKAIAPGSPIDRKEINFKGGQVGDENYFGVLRQGVL